MTKTIELDIPQDAAERVARQDAWKCSNCGRPHPDRVRSCDCPTGCLFRMEGKRMLHEVKIGGPSDPTSLATLWQAIVDNTKGDLFWIGEILLNELEKETGFRPSA